MERRRNRVRLQFISYILRSIVISSYMRHIDCSLNRASLLNRRTKKSSCSFTKYTSRLIPVHVDERCRVGVPEVSRQAVATCLSLALARCHHWRKDIMSVRLRRPLLTWPKGACSSPIRNGPTCHHRSFISTRPQPQPQSQSRVAYLGIGAILGGIVTAGFTYLNASETPESQWLSSLREARPTEYADRQTMLKVRRKAHEPGAD